MAHTKINRKIAKRVMGWKITRLKNNQNVELWQDTENYKDYIIRKWAHHWELHPDFVGSWDGAGLVIEKMVKDGWSYTFSFDENSMLAQFSKGNCTGEVRFYAVVQMSITQAICEAALKAIAEETARNTSFIKWTYHEIDRETFYPRQIRS